MPHTGENVVRIEAEALNALADRLAGPMRQSFDGAVDLLFRCTARVVVTGMGKSGIMAQKIAATLSSTGTPSLFMHPAEALHGDLGMVASGDVVIALSSSGETEELLKLLAKIKRVGDALICFTCDLKSTLAQASDVALDCSVPREGCNLGLAPTASTTAMLALGDALAVVLSEKRGFKEEDFADATQIFECQIHSARTIYNTLIGGGPLSRASAMTSESMVCRYSEEFNTYLRKNYNLNDDALEFFTVHMVADKEHTAQAAERIGLAVKTPRDERLVRENAQYTVRIKLGKFEGLYREYS